MTDGLEDIKTVEKEYNDLFRRMGSLKQKIDNLTSESSIDAVLEIAHEYEAIRGKVFELEDRLY